MTSRRAPVLSRLLREEEGGFLVEILVSAVILVVVALGVVAAFDTTAAQSGQQRAQAVASNLAASEMERLRSLRFGDLNAQNGVRPAQSVGGITYTVTNSIDQTGTPAPAGGGCETSTRSAEALRATTTVTWPSQRNQRPVRLTSLIAAPANASSTRGIVVVQVTNYDGFGVPGLSISLAGASSATATTDTNGCVRFTDMLAGSGYRITFSRPNWVDALGRNAIDDPIDVIAGTKQTKTYQYDQMGTATANFYSTADGTAGGTRVASPRLGATWSHANMATPRTQTITPASASVVSPLLPVRSGAYTVTAGTCASTVPALFQGAATIPDGIAQVRVPTVRITVEGRGVGSSGNSMANASGARIFLTTCDGRHQHTASTGNGNAAGIWTGGVPYTTSPIAICADGTYNGSRFIGNGTITPLATDGIATATVEISRTTTAPLTC